RVLSYRGMRAAPCLDADDVIGVERLRARKDQRILLSVDVVRHDGDVVALPHSLAQCIDQARLSGADGASDSDAQNARSHCRLPPHERNSRVYWVSCRALAIA